MREYNCVLRKGQAKTLKESIAEIQYALTPKEQEEFVRKFFGMDDINFEAQQAKIRKMIGEEDHRDFTALGE